ncbi:hypothetical protein, conserved [Leishmania lindenbergi]|uniref:Uncharacterized protein n=1 Tax=Leishmania lindenbergi TaxID=651832 RepID=A0AAW3AER8_9TRYP
MNIDLFLLFEAVTTSIFGVVLFAIIITSISACLQREHRMKERGQQCEELVVMTTEKQQQLQWLSGINNLTDSPNLCGDAVSLSYLSSR